VPPETHVPAPLQVGAAVNVDDPAGQDGAPHTIPAPYLRHAPAPSHLPSVPQVAAPRSAQEPAGSLPPDGTAEQVPSFPGTAQDRQTPTQSPAQQTPCWQEPDLHSCPTLHEAPFSFLPQEKFWQGLPETHCALFTHWEKQRALAPSHMKGAHERGAAATHDPFPSHREGGAPVDVPPGQLPALHTVPSAYLRHPPEPLHLPSVPQLAGPLSLQVPLGSAPPPGTLVHVPNDAESAHDRQAPLQAAAQQMPCAQKPDLHSEAAPHEAPVFFLPH